MSYKAIKLAFSGKIVCENCGNGITKHRIGGFDKLDECPEPYPGWGNMIEHYLHLEEILIAAERIILKTTEATIEAAVLPCGCDPSGDPVKWNPYNRVVQCHSCGKVYKPNKNKNDGKKVF